MPAGPGVVWKLRRQVRRSLVVWSEPSEASIFERARAGTMVGRAVASAVSLGSRKSISWRFCRPRLWSSLFEAANSEMIRRCGLDFSRGQIVPVGLGGKAPIVGAAAIGFRV